ncbi:MAG: class I SAM-dependent methyltransferase [Ardenticatenaceae bacterium]|nr:class I SAM-dependent methyltransferase [Ardenticatenaceae bacterium]
MSENELRCTHTGCGAVFPIVDGVPVLINEQASVFSIADFVDQRDTYFDLSPESRGKSALRRMMPTISGNTKGRQNYERFARLLKSESARPTVLVLGGSILGQGMEALASDVSIELVETDISFGPHTKLICDAHDIPFGDDSFDGVIVQAVLEHVVDPYRCVDEIHRVLRKEGLVYAETPFMQQVHGGRYDFARFTHLGHRRLFRKFTEVESGAVCGPGMALAWSYQYFLLSFVQTEALRKLIRVFTAVTAFYLKYFDTYLVDKPGALDAASGYYFLGRKSEALLPDRQLVQLYRGAM